MGLDLQNLVSSLVKVQEGIGGRSFEFVGCRFACVYGFDHFCLLDALEFGVFT